MNILEFLKKIDELKDEFTYFNVWCKLATVSLDKVSPRIQQVNITLKIGDYEYQNINRYENYGYSPDIYKDFTETFENINTFIAKSKAKQAIDLI